MHFRDGGWRSPNSSGTQRSRFTTVVKTAVSQELELRVMMANRDPCSLRLTELKSYSQQNYGGDGTIHVAPPKLSSEVFDLKGPNVICLWLKTHPHVKLIKDSREWKNDRNDKGKQMQTSRRWKLGDETKKKWGGRLHMWVFPDIKASKDSAREELIPDDNVHMQRNSFPETGRHLILLRMVLIDLGICTSSPEMRRYFIIFQHRYISLSFRITSWEFRTKYDGMVKMSCNDFWGLAWSLRTSEMH